MPEHPSAPAWLALLADLPAEGDLTRVPMPDGPLSGWHEVVLVLSEPPAGLRILTALLDPAGRATSVSDLVAFGDALRQESMGARLDPDGRVDGTHWVTVGASHTASALNEAERAGLARLAAVLEARAGTGDRKSFP